MDPFMDLSSMTDEELRERLMKLQTRLYAAYTYGMSYDMRAQLENMAQQVQELLLMRNAAELQQIWDDQFPDIIVSDAGYDDAEKSVKSKTDQKDVLHQDQPTRPAPRFQKVYKKK